MTRLEVALCCIRASRVLDALERAFRFIQSTDPGLRVLTDLRGSLRAVHRDIRHVAAVLSTEFDQEELADNFESTPPSIDQHALYNNSRWSDD